MVAGGTAGRSAPERVADLLRGRIAEGRFPPGGHLSEEALGRDLGVSRNTLREAFRLLCHEGLAVHELHRGVSVRRLDVQDVVDLYRLRRLLEAAALQRSPDASPASRLAVMDAARLAAAEMGRQAWPAVQTANVRFHQAVTALAGSRRVDQWMRQALAELRLAFHAVADPSRFHPPFVEGNLVIARLVLAGDGAGAAHELLVYLDRAESDMLAAFGRLDGTRPARPWPGG